MNRVHFALALAAAAMAGCDATAGSPSGPDGQNPLPSSAVMFQGHSYFLTASGDWNAAEAEAVSHGGHLAAVGSQAEQDFLTSYFCTPKVPFWIGASDIGHRGTYAWSSGEPMSFTAWSPGEPNDWTGDEDYAAMNWHFAEGNGMRGLWNDAPLAGTKGYPGTTNGPYQGVAEVP
jgi:hypothetical protein